MASLKLILVFLLILYALRKKASVGVTLFGAGLLTALLFRIPFNEIMDGYWTLIRSQRFISLTAVICLITVLGSLLKELGFLQRLSDSCRGLYGGRRTAAGLLPPLVGFMPMPGGALLSAPLVDEVLADRRYSAEFKCTVNYWFRHVVEHFMPIYPGMILTEAITGLPAGKVALLQFPLAIFMILIGYIFFLRKIDNSNTDIGKPRQSLPVTIMNILVTLRPVAAVLVLYGVFNIDMALAALAVIILLVLVTRPPKNSLIISLKKGFTYKLVLLVFGIMSFQTMLDLSGSIRSIEQLSTAYNLPPELIIIMVCFTAGILTGMYAAYVALGYSLLAGFIFQPVLVPSNLLLAFLSGYVGMILSPTHLCLIVTNEYFKSDLFKVLRKLVLPSILLGLVGYLLYYIDWGTIIVR
ncbi:MAG: DUF401 family protein [Candidatus Zixiibacteriota bacterium]